MSKPSFSADLKYELERLWASINELNRKRDRRPPNLRDLQDVNGHGALQGYQPFYDTTVGRYKMAIPPPMVTFNQNGALTVAGSDLFPVPANCKLFLVRARLKTAGSSTTTSVLKKNASTTVATFSFTSGNTTPTTTPSVSTTLVDGDYLWVDTTAAGSSAAGLVVAVWAMASSAPS